MEGQLGIEAVEHKMVESHIAVADIQMACRQVLVWKSKFERLVGSKIAWEHRTVEEDKTAWEEDMQLVCKIVEGQSTVADCRMVEQHTEPGILVCTSLQEAREQ